jgi:hypothetical protein
VSKARKRHRQPWWKNKRKAKSRLQWERFAEALEEIFPRGYCVATVDVPAPACDHGVTFDAEKARALLGDWGPTDAVEFIMGSPASAEVRRRWPRLHGECPKGCGYNGIAYASADHYAMGDW